MREEPTVAERLQAVRSRIAAACERRGRPPGDVTLVGASKSQPVERMRAAWEAGLRIFGENHVQEAREKAERMPAGVEWHLLGPLQSNKARRAADLFRVIHSLDRLKIARRLDREGERLGRRIPVFVEINVGGEETKHGFRPGAALERIWPLADLPGLEVVGLMAIPPYEPDPEASRPWFVRLRELRDHLLQQPEWSRCPGFLSLGMSHDFEIAVEEGATHVRVGTALFGPRP